MFKLGDRVQLANRIAADEHEPVGTVAGLVTPEFAARIGAPDDVIVQWDSGLVLAHAPFALMLAPADARDRHVVAGDGCEEGEEPQPAG